MLAFHIYHKFAGAVPKLGCLLTAAVLPVAVVAPPVSVRLLLAATPKLKLFSPPNVPPVPVSVPESETVMLELILTPQLSELLPLVVPLVPLSLLESETVAFTPTRTP